MIDSHNKLCSKTRLRSAPSVRGRPPARPRPDRSLKLERDRLQPHRQQARASQLAARAGQHGAGAELKHHDLPRGRVLRPVWPSVAHARLLDCGVANEACGQTATGGCLQHPARKHHYAKRLREVAGTRGATSAPTPCVARPARPVKIPPDFVNQPTVYFVLGCPAASEW